MKSEQDAGGTGLCSFCGRRCHVPVTRFMPDAVRAAYDKAGVVEMATCEDGAADEHRRLGASYADVIVARVARLSEPKPPPPPPPSLAELRAQVEEARKISRATREQRQEILNQTSAIIARADQVMARSQELKECVDAQREQWGKPHEPAPGASAHRSEP